MPESTRSNIAPGSLPTLPALIIPPVGIEVYTDLGRQKSFTTLHFKHFGGSQTDVLVWVGDVLDELTAAGLPPSGPCENTLTPDVARSTGNKAKWRCYLKVPVEIKE